MKIAIGITEKNLLKGTHHLSRLLADEMTLYVKTRKFHWNVSGDSFMEYHKLFEGQYKDLEEAIDEIAERIGKLGHKTIGTMQEYGKLSTIKESPGKYPSSNDALHELLKDHETIVQHLRKDIIEISKNSHDLGTADFLTGLLEHHETTAWILRRYLN